MRFNQGQNLYVSLKISHLFWCKSMLNVFMVLKLHFKVRNSELSFEHVQSGFHHWYSVPHYFWDLIYGPIQQYHVILAEYTVQSATIPNLD